MENTPDFPNCTQFLTDVVTGPQRRNISIVPNPASTWLRFDLPAETDFTYMLYDIQGRLLQQQKLQGGQQQVALPVLLPGVYVVTLEAADGWRQVEKVVVK